MKEEPKKNRIRNKGEGTPEFNKTTGKYRYVAKVNGQRVCGSWSPTRRAAKESLQARLAAEGPRKRIGPPSLQDFAKTVLEGSLHSRVLGSKLLPKSWGIYEQCWRLRLYGTALGSTPVDVVTSEQIDGWLATLATEPVTRFDKRTGETLVVRPRLPLGDWAKLKDLTFLRAVFKQAVKVRYRPDNPVLDVERPATPESTFRTLSGEEFRRLISHAAKYQEEANFGKWQEQSPNPKRLELILWLLVHGLGPSEATGLKKEDFKLDELGRPFLSVVSGADNGVRTDRVKTKNRRREVPVWPELWDLVKDLPEGFVLASTNGAAMRRENLRRLWKSLIKGTEFEGMDPYDLRHTYAQALLDSGVDARTGAELMGNTPEVFLRVYVKSDLSRKFAAMDRATLSGGTPKSTPRTTIPYSK